MKGKKTAALLALFLGIIGAQKFYLNRHVQGITYLALSVFLISPILAVIDFFNLYYMSQSEFDIKYNNKNTHCGICNCKINYWNIYQSRISYLGDSSKICMKCSREISKIDTKFMLQAIEKHTISDAKKLLSDGRAISLPENNYAITERNNKTTRAFFLCFSAMLVLTFTLNSNKNHFTDFLQMQSMFAMPFAFIFGFLFLFWKKTKRGFRHFFVGWWSAAFLLGILFSLFERIFGSDFDTFLPINITVSVSLSASIIFAYINHKRLISNNILRQIPTQTSGFNTEIHCPVCNNTGVLNGENEFIEIHFDNQVCFACKGTLKADSKLKENIFRDIEERKGVMTNAEKQLAKKQALYQNSENIHTQGENIIQINVLEALAVTMQNTKKAIGFHENTILYNKQIIQALYKVLYNLHVIKSIEYETENDPTDELTTSYKDSYIANQKIKDSLSAAVGEIHSIAFKIENQTNITGIYATELNKIIAELKNEIINCE